MLLEGKPYTVPNLKVLISGFDISTTKVHGSTLKSPTLFLKLPILHHKEAESWFVLLFAVLYKI